MQTIPQSHFSLAPAERRNGARIQVNLPAIYDSAGVHLEGHVSNLAPGGVFVRSPYLDDPGATVGIRFALPNETRPIAVRGRVVRVDTSSICPGMAIQFTKVAPAVRAKLSQFLARR